MSDGDGPLSLHKNEQSDGIGDRALFFRDDVGGGRSAVAAQRGGWLVDFTVRGPRDLVDEPALIELARQAIARLPTSP